MSELETVRLNLKKGFIRFTVGYVLVCVMTLIAFYAYVWDIVGKYENGRTVSLLIGGLCLVFLFVTLTNVINHRFTFTATGLQMKQLFKTKEVAYEAMDKLVFPIGHFDMKTESELLSLNKKVYLIPDRYTNRDEAIQFMKKRLTQNPIPSLTMHIGPEVFESSF